MPKANEAFKYVRADEVAECWDGVSDSLYQSLWNKVVANMPPMPNLEDFGPADMVGVHNLAQFWHLLSEEEQTELNALAELRDKWE